MDFNAKKLYTAKTAAAALDLPEVTVNDWFERAARGLYGDPLGAGLPVTRDASGGIVLDGESLRLLLKRNYANVELAYKARTFTRAYPDFGGTIISL